KISKELISKISIISLELELPCFYSYKYKYQHLVSIKPDDDGKKTWVDLIYSQIYYKRDNIDYSIIIDKYISIPIIENVQKMMKEQNLFSPSFINDLENTKMYKFLSQIYCILSTIIILLLFFPSVILINLFYEKGIIDIIFFPKICVFIILFFSAIFNILLII